MTDNARRRKPLDIPDQHDTCVYLLRTCWLALQQPDELDSDAILSISGTLETAIDMLAPVRDAISAIDETTTL